MYAEDNFLAGQDRNLETYADAMERRIAALEKIVARYELNEVDL